MREHFLLRPDICFLNFGSFGACPKPVFEAYQRFQLELEQSPVQFMMQDGMAYLRKSREALGVYIGCHADDVVFVTNPSYAVNAVARSIGLQAGDEVLSTHVEYGACDRAWEYYCQKAGASCIRQPISLPLTTKEQFVSDFFAGVSERTKLIFISHITSSTALIFPVAEVIQRAHELNIPVFVDGAHASGHIPLNLESLQADYYTGACHKWMMTPKGSSFLYVKKELQHRIDPLIVSWGYKALFPSQSQFLDYHQMNGTRDFSAFLCVPAAVSFMEEHQWTQKAASCRELVYSNADRFARLLNTTPLAPLHTEFIGQMLSLKINVQEPEAFKAMLYSKYRIEIPIMRQENECYIRFSIQAFNTQHDLDSLYEALDAELG